MVGKDSGSYIKSFQGQLRKPREEHLTERLVWGSRRRGLPESPLGSLSCQGGLSCTVQVILSVPQENSQCSVWFAEASLSLCSAQVNSTSINSLSFLVCSEYENNTIWSLPLKGLQSIGDREKVVLEFLSSAPRRREFLHCCNPTAKNSVWDIVVT